MTRSDRAGGTEPASVGSLRAMILAAGLGTRMRPLTEHRAKPALPVCGRPVISLLLEVLARHGVREVMINLHHLPDTIRSAVEEDHPAGMEIDWSDERVPLGTGGGIERAAGFLREADDCLVLAGDMLLDADLGGLLERHRATDHDVSLVLRDDPRTVDFGSIGLDAAGRVVRIGERPIEAPGAGPEARQGLFTSLRFFRREALDAWPTASGEAFEDLRDWLAPRVAADALRLGGLIAEATSTVWEPVGTPAEYLRANLHPPVLPSLGDTTAAWRGALRDDAGRDCVIDARARLAADATLERCVVWDDAVVPAGFRGRDGVYAGDHFRDCATRSESDSIARGAGAEHGSESMVCGGSL